MTTIAPDALVHEDACVESGATIGARTKVWQFASVIRNANVGDDCNIASCAIVDGSRLGDRCLVGHGAFIDPGTEIGHDVFIGPNVSLCNDFWPRTSKAGWFNMPDLIEGWIIVTRIGDGASVGANAVLLPGITLGYGAMIAAGAVVERDVPEMHLYKRDGTMVPIDTARAKRMRWVARS